MKTRTIAGLLAAPLLFAAPAHALSTRAGVATPMAAPSHPSRRHEAIQAIRDEALTLQDADGGTLTQSHRTYLQAKLDAIRDGIY
jgi:hypothetical protein